MLCDNDDIDLLAAEIERIRTEFPHLDGLLRAFGPLILARNRWLNDVREYTRVFPVDPVQYLGGVPLSQQCQIFFPEDPWQKAGLSVAAAISFGFPHCAEDMAALADKIADGTFNCFALMSCPAAPDDAQITASATELGIEPQVLLLFQRFLRQFMLSKRARDMAAELASLSWKKGYCPVCGSFPQLAIIRELGQRWLQCGDCNHEWQFSRLTCPSCGHEDPENTNFLFVEGKKEETAFTCSQCRKYLLTSNRPVEMRKTSADLIALSLAHLDLILQEKGFQPMVVTGWNTFGSAGELTDLCMGLTY